MARFNTANAREMAARSIEARKQRNAVPALPPLPPIQEADQYARERLARVRAQQDKIDAMILTERDPQKLDRLASASMRLSDQEFALAGRPKPGNLKHVAPKYVRPQLPEPTFPQFLTTTVR
jgi:hypothetical protein